MIRNLRKWLLRFIGSVLFFAIVLAAPIVYVETACKSDLPPQAYTAIYPDQSWQRDESRTLMTYPEWHIVHVYDDYGEVIIPSLLQNPKTLV